MVSKSTCVEGEFLWVINVVMLAVKSAAPKIVPSVKSASAAALAAPAPHRRIAAAINRGKKLSATQRS